jgi:hypothetical protein
MPGVMVTLHRVGPDSSGPVDSVRTDARGHYSLRYPRFGDEAAVYFAAAVYRGIAYFSSPLRGARASGDDAEITVFDTTSRPLALHVRGHHVVVSSPHPDGTRDIIEVWELSNDTTLTAVGRDSLTPVWRVQLPAGAQKFVGGPGDVAASALSTRGDSVVLLAAFGPGVKQLSYTYALPPSRFPLRFSAAQPTGVFEVLVEEAGGQVSGGTLRAMDAATTQGRTFKRWLGQEVAPGQSVLITVPTTSAAVRTRLLIALASLIVAAMAVALVRALRTRGGPEPLVVQAAPTRDSLIAQIATLDARQEHGDSALSADAYTAERTRIKAELAALLAGSNRTT